MSTMTIINGTAESTKKSVAKKVSKTLEAARRLKGSLIVNDPILYFQ